MAVVAMGLEEAAVTLALVAIVLVAAGVGLVVAAVGLAVVALTPSRKISSCRAQTTPLPRRRPLLIAR